MPFLIQQREGRRNVVVLKYAALFYWLMWPTLGVTALSSVVSGTWVGVVVGLSWALLLAVAVPYWPTIFKLKRLMKERTIRVQGSKYSFSNPLRYEWEEQ